MAAVAHIPTQANVEALWQRYADLMREMLDDTSLFVSPAHCQAAALAWDAWRDAFLAQERGR